MTESTFPFPSDYLTRPEGQLRVITAGDPDNPPVLLLSGAGVDSATLSWRHLIPALAPDYRVLALDWPKQGESTPWHGLADQKVLIRCVLEVLDHYGHDQATLIGMSQGGAITLATAIEHPDRVSRLVAISPAGAISFPPVIHQLLWLIAKSRFLGTTLPGWMFRGRAGVALMLRYALFAGPAPDFDHVVDEILAEVAANGAGSSDWQNASIGFRKMNVNLLDRLEEISSPALFIQGEKDIGVRPKHTIAAAGLVPGARLELLPGNGHWSNRQSPDHVNTLIRDFLAETAVR